MPIGHYQKIANTKRNNRIAGMYLIQEMSQKRIARIMGMTLSNVRQIIWKRGGRDGIAKQLGRAAGGKMKVPERIVPLVDETDLLKAGLRAARDKYQRAFILAAFNLPDEDKIVKLKYEEMINLVVKLYPLMEKIEKARSARQPVFSFRVGDYS
jgi:hypothetical protein